MMNYICRFIRNYSDKTSKLRELLSDKNKWEWTNDHQNCFEELKNSLQGPNVLTF